MMDNKPRMKISAQYMLDHVCFMYIRWCHVLCVG